MVYGKGKPVVDAVSQSPRETYAFLDGILMDAGMGSIDKRTHNEMIEMLYNHLDAFLLGQIVEHLPEKHVDAFLEMLDQKGSKAKTVRFLKTQISDMREVVTDAFGDFKALYDRRLLMYVWVNWSMHF